MGLENYQTSFTLPILVCCLFSTSYSSGRITRGCGAITNRLKEKQTFEI